MDKYIKRMTIYFPQECLDTGTPYLTITNVENRSQNRISRTQGNVNLTDYWFSILEDLKVQDMSYTCQHIMLLSDECSWWEKQIQRQRVWAGFVFLKIKTDIYASLRTIEMKVKQCCENSSFFHTLGNADLIFSFAVSEREELKKVLEEIRALRDIDGERLFFSQYAVYGEYKQMGEQSWEISDVQMDSGNGCLKHVLYQEGWCKQVISQLQMRIGISLEQKNKKMTSYYQALLQILNVIGQYEQEKIYKDLFYIYYPPISLFLEQLEKALDEIDKEAAGKEREKKQRKVERAISEFVDVIEVLMSHMGHSCRDVLNNNGRGGMQYDIPIRLCFMYIAYLNIITEILNDCKEYEYQYCLSPLAYSRPMTQYFDFGLPPKSRVIRVQISRSTMFMPRPLLVILAHEASHYAGHATRNRKMRAECYLNIVVIAVCERLFLERILKREECPQEMEESFRCYWNTLKRNVYLYLCRAVKEEWKSRYAKADYEYTFAVFLRDVEIIMKDILEDNGGSLREYLCFLDKETKVMLREHKFTETLSKGIFSVQNELQSRVVRVWNLESLQEDLNKLARNFKEIYADISAVLLLRLSPNDFLEAYIISEGCIPNEISITSDLINRVAMVKNVIVKMDDNTELCQQWKEWGEKEDDDLEWAGKEFISQLKKKVDCYLGKYFPEQLSNEAQESKETQEQNILSEGKDLFYCVQILAYQERYFLQCCKSMKENLNRNDSKGIDIKKRQELLIKLFQNFKANKRGEDSSVSAFFSDYGKLLNCYKKDVEKNYMAHLGS